MYRVLSLILFLATLVYAQDQLTRDAENRLGTANNRLTAIFLYNGYKKYPGASFVTSLFPALSTFGILAKFSKGVTRRKLYQAIELQNEQQINVIFRYVTNNYFSERLITSPKYTIKLYTDDDNKFCPKFQNAFEKYFYGDTGIVDYSEPEEAAREINDYVKKQGTGHFKDLVVSRKIEDKKGINSISTFEVKYQFDKRFVFTKDVIVPFKGDKGLENIKGAFGKGVVKYAYVQSIDAVTVEILGRGEEFSFFVVAPRKRSGLINILDKFRDPEFFQQVLEEGTEICATITTPGREIIKTIDLGNSFKDLPYYYNDLFVPGSAELRGVTETCDNSYIASLLQELRMVPDSTNRTTEGIPCSSYEKEFVFDEPFLIYLMCAKKQPNFVRSPLLGIVIRS